MGAVAVAIIIRREKELVARFHQLGALSPATAVTPEAVGSDRRVAWRRLIKRAVIRPADHGTFYLDVPSWNAMLYVRRRMIGVLFFVLAIVLATVLWTQTR
jgi:hypothetical protein